MTAPDRSDAAEPTPAPMPAPMPSPMPSPMPATVRGPAAEARMPATAPPGDDSEPGPQLRLVQDLAADSTVPPALQALLDRHFSTGELPQPAAPDGARPAIDDRGRQVVEFLRRQHLATNTRLQYRWHVLAWTAWCTERGYRPYPADAEQFALHLAGYVLGDAILTGPAPDASEDTGPNPEDVQLTALVAVSTAQLRTFAVDKLHQLDGQAGPGASAVVREVLAGLRRKLGSRRRFQRGALDIDRLETVLAALAWADLLEQRRQVASALHHRHGATPGQLARLRWPAVVSDPLGLAVDLPPDRRYRPTTTLRLLRSRPRDRPAIQALEDLGRDRTGGQEFVLGKPDSTPLTRQGVMKMLAAAPTARTDRSQFRVAHHRGLLLTGWHAALRRSNLSSALWHDLEHEPGEGWLLTLPFSKTDQEGAGHLVELAYAGSSSTRSCPAAALDQWLRLLTERLGYDPRLAQHPVPLFPRLTAVGDLALDRAGRPMPMSGDSINALIASLAAKAGLLKSYPDALVDGRNPFGGHSLRVGFISTAIREKIDIAEIALVTGHRSFGTLLGYYRAISLRRNSPSRRILGHGGDGATPTGTRVAATARRSMR